MLQEFINKLQEGNIIECRSMLANEILWNNSPKEIVNKMIKLGEEKGVFEEHDGRFLNFDKERWTQNYIEELCSDLTINFSRIRYELAYFIALQLAKENNSNFKEIPKEKSPFSNKNMKPIYAAIGVAVLVGVFLIKKA